MFNPLPLTFNDILSARIFYGATKTLGLKISQQVSGSIVDMDIRDPSKIHEDVQHIDRTIHKLVEH